jgi:hypothetical protein
MERAIRWRADTDMRCCVIDSSGDMTIAVVVWCAMSILAAEIAVNTNMTSALAAEKVAELIDKVSRHHQQRWRSRWEHDRATGRIRRRSPQSGQVQHVNSLLKTMWTPGVPLSEPKWGSQLEGGQRNI